MDQILHFFHSLVTSEGLRHLITTGGYAALFAIIFSETGLLIGFFLPGDSLLVSTGLLIATGVVDMNVALLIALLSFAAIAGDAVGFYIGKRAGHKLYDRPDTRFFKKEHLRKTHAFYEHHGGKTIVLARFIPVVRTFAPVVAGAADMEYRHFVVYNVIGGILWISSTILLGYFLARVVPNVDKYLHLIILGVIVLSIIPPILEWLRQRRVAAAKQEKV